MNSRTSIRIADPLARGALCAILAMGCTTGGPTDNDTTPPQELPDPYPENRGQSLPVFEVSTASSIRWEDPAEIVYNTEGTFREVRALRLSDLSSRTLHQGWTVSYWSYRGIEVSPDGTQIYAVFTKPLAVDLDLVHIAAGVAPVVIAINPGSSGGSTTRNAAWGATILPTPDSRGAAYAVAPDSMRMYDVATRTSRRIGEGCVSPVTFSPDGQRLLCLAQGALVIMTVSDGSLEPVAPRDALLTSVFWGPGGIQLLRRPNGLNAGLSIVNVTTGASKELVRPGQFRLFENLDDHNIAWSRDGRKVAVSTSRPTELLSPTYELVVYVIDTETAVSQRVAVIKLGTAHASPPAISDMAFSPDGRSLVYSAGTELGAVVYVAPVQ